MSSFPFLPRTISLVDRHSGIHQGTRRCRCSYFTGTVTAGDVQIERSRCTETSADSEHLYSITHSGSRSRLVGLAGVPVPGLHRGHAALAIRLDPVVDSSDAYAEQFGGLLLPHAVRHRFDRLGPHLRRDDWFRHMASIPGIRRQPAFQALPGRIAQMPHHLGRGHRRGEIQLHRTSPFLGTGHMIILSFSLQENVRSPPYRLARSRIRCKLRYFYLKGET